MLLKKTIPASQDIALMEKPTVIYERNYPQAKQIARCATLSSQYLVAIARSATTFCACHALKSMIMKPDICVQTASIKSDSDTGIVT